MSATPVSDKAISDAFPDFIEAVRTRLRAGAAAYGDASFSQDPTRLLFEIEQECLDQAGWGFISWFRVRQMREALAPHGTWGPREASVPEWCQRCGIRSDSPDKYNACMYPGHGTQPLVHIWSRTEPRKFPDGPIRRVWCSRCDIDRNIETEVTRCPLNVHGSSHDWVSVA